MLTVFCHGPPPAEAATALGCTSVIWLPCLIGLRGSKSAANRDGGEGLDVATAGAGVGTSGTRPVWQQPQQQENAWRQKP